MTVTQPAAPTDTAQLATTISEERPWGSWHVLSLGEGWKVKRLEVTPGQRLSYQSHRFRSEHWVVVRGVATSIIDGVQSVTPVGGSVDVPCGARHRLANFGSEELVVIEVQLGSSTAEEDIERYEDDYGRSAPAPLPWDHLGTSPHC